MTVTSIQLRHYFTYFSVPSFLFFIFCKIQKMKYSTVSITSRSQRCCKTYYSTREHHTVESDPVTILGSVNLKHHYEQRPCQPESRLMNLWNNFKEMLCLIQNV